MPFRRQAARVGTVPSLSRPGMDILYERFPSVYGGGRGCVQVDNGPVDLSQVYEGNDNDRIIPTDVWGLYDFSADFHTLPRSTHENRYYKMGRRWIQSNSTRPVIIIVMS